ncbi:MAG: hypothetical protein IJJ33_03430 [Victivallales bacterium]|nr:hypothetical protein [Victivallales bacterium]
MTISQRVFCFLFSMILCLAVNVSFAEETQTTVVISRGIGTSADEALKDAFVQAVQQVAGCLMSAETMVQNDEIIKDKVLTYSDGFVNKYDVLRPVAEKQPGMFEVTIKATVEQKKIMKRLQDANILRNEVKGMENVWAQMVTKEINKEKAEEFLINALDKLNPVDFLVPTFIDNEGRTGSEAQPTVIPQADGDTVKFNIGVVVTFNHKKYVTEVMPYLKDVFEKTCAKKTQSVQLERRYDDVIMAFKKSKDGLRNYLININHRNIDATVLNVSRTCYNDFDGLVYSFHRGDGGNWACFYFNVSKRYSLLTQDYVEFRYHKTNSLLNYFSYLRKKSYCNCILTLKDSDGNNIAIQKERCRYVLFQRDSNIFILSPEFRENSCSPSDYIVFNLIMNKDDVRDVKLMEVSFEVAKYQ